MSRAGAMRWLCVIVCIFSVLVLTSPADALSDLHGRITDSKTGYGIEGALVGIDVDPADGVNEHAAHTDIFGFYTLPQVESGTYEVTASHPAYESGLVPDLALADAGRVEQSLALTPKYVLPTFDVYMQVNCVVTSLALKDVPVEMTVIPDKPGTFGDTVTRSGKTDSNGFLYLTGLPAGFFSFSVNTGDSAIPGWESYQAAEPYYLAGPHAADIGLMPVLSSIDVHVYGFNPVTEEEGVLLEGIYVEATGVDPNYLDHELMPTRTGVSAITKENPEAQPGAIIWDNSRKGKVRFTGLPPIDWMIGCKRLGYEPGNRHIRTGNDAKFIYDDAGTMSVRVNMSMLDTRLTVVLDSDYQDRKMLDGKITVRIQGLMDTNTAGIDRQGKVTYNNTLDRAEIEFDRILPGTYRLTAAGTTTKNIDIRAGDPVNGELIKSKAFDIRFTADTYVDALPDVNEKVDVHLDPSPMTFRGQLVRVDEEALEINSGNYIHLPTRAAGITFRVSEYMADMIPPAHRAVTVDSDEKGEFTVNLLPGLYGIVVPGMDDYWGEAVETVPADGSDREYAGWPYYQIWPFSAAEAHFYYNAGGMPVSSDQELRGMVFLRKDWIDVECRISVEKDPTANQVVAIDKSEGPGHYIKELMKYDDVLEENTTVTLIGPSEQTVPATKNAYGDPGARFVRVLPGSYRVVFNHPRYTVSNPVVFEYLDFNTPGDLPQNMPPEYSAGIPYPMYPFELQVPVDCSKCGSTEITVHQWSPPAEEGQSGQYIDASNENIPIYLKTDFAGERIFNYGGNTPGSSYKVWLDLNGYFNSGENHWYMLEDDGGDLKADIYIPSSGGISGTADTTTVDPLDAAYNLTIITLDINDPEGPAIPNVTVPFRDSDETVRTSGNTYTNLTGSLEVKFGDITHPNWSYANHYTRSVSMPSEGLPSITLTLFMKQGVAIRGSVSNKETGSPVPGASITVMKNRGDGAILGPPSGADGKFEYPYTWDGLKVYYIEVNARGYQTYRRRLNPNEATVNADDPRAKDYNLDIKLTPLEGPAVADSDVSFDRYGSFLPSVSRAGNQSAFNGLKADEQLTLTWDLAATRKKHTYTLPQVDDSEGNARGDVTLEFQDDVAEVWLVDLRSFENNIYDDEAQAVTVPPENDPHLVLAWLEKISRGDASVPNVFHQQVLRFSEGADEDQKRAQNQVKLWRLPPDKFTPAFVVVSRMGAVTVYPFHEKEAYLGRELAGMRMPPWMGFLANVLGTVAGAQATIAQVEEFMPEGRFQALPAFTADIELVGDYYLDYHYAVDVNLKEGMDGPAQGMMGLAPGILGLDLTAKLDAGMNGQDREFYIGLEGGISSNNLDEKGFKPSFFKNLGVSVNFDPSPYGSISTKTSQSLTAENRPNDFQITHQVSGTVGAKVSVSILKILQKIPNVGQVLLLAEKAQVINKADAYTRGLIGLTSTTTWRTVYPHEIEHYVEEGYGGSIIVDPETAKQHQLRRHFLGGDENAENEPEEESLKTKFDICFGFGVGLEVAALGNRVGATGEIALAGDDCGKTNEPALTIETNPIGDWPPIRRISGDVRATLNAYLDVWLTKIEKEYVWKAIEIDIPMGEKEEAAAQGARAPMALAFPKTTFTLTPMEITVSEVKRSEYPPADFEGTAPQVIQNFVPMGDYAGSATDNEQIMLFSDMDATGEVMLLKAALRNTGAWGNVSIIAQTGGAIVDTAAAAAGDKWMAVWSEISSDDTANIYAPSTIRYALRDTSGEWTNPATVVDSLNGLGTELRLIPLGNTVALVYLETDEGPGADTFTIQGTVWDGSAWSAPVEILSYSDLTDFDAAGSGDLSAHPARIAYTDAGGVLHVIDWDGTDALKDPCEPLTGTSTTVEDVSLILGADGAHYLAYSDEERGIGLLAAPTGANWVDRGICVADIDPGDLKIAFLDGAVPVLLFTWTEGGGVSSLHYGFTAADGTVLVGPAGLTGNGKGHYFDVMLLPESGERATVMTRFRNNAVQELRSFTLAYPDGPVFSDIDEDGVDDRAELLVVDADSQDDIRTVYDVAPGADFDGDGYGNAEEISAGADPSWAGDHPWYGDIRRDGVLDLADVIAGLQLLTNTGGATTDTIADVNLDGCIGHYEILYVLRTISSVQ